MSTANELPMSAQHDIELLERNARSIARRLANAIQKFRNCPQLRTATKLRESTEYGELCRVWEAFTFDTDSWRDAVERAEHAEIALIATHAELAAVKAERDEARAIIQELLRFATPHQTCTQWQGGECSCGYHDAVARAKKAINV